jgi:hypothetical protein
MSENRLDELAALDSALAGTSTPADRDEQLNADFRPLTCSGCGTEVRVRKRSPQQTSVQWQNSASDTCPFLARKSPAGALSEGCPTLSETIRAAAQAGVIPSGTP